MRITRTSHHCRCTSASPSSAPRVQDMRSAARASSGTASSGCCAETWTRMCRYRRRMRHSAAVMALCCAGCRSYARRRASVEEFEASIATHRTCRAVVAANRGRSKNSFGPGSRVRAGCLTPQIALHSGRCCARTVAWRQVQQARGSVDPPACAKATSLCGFPRRSAGRSCRHPHIPCGYDTSCVSGRRVWWPQRVVKV